MTRLFPALAFLCVLHHTQRIFLREFLSYHHHSSLAAFPTSYIRLMSFLLMPSTSTSHHRQSSAASQAYSVASSIRHLNDHAPIEPISSPFANPLVTANSVDSVKDFGIRMTPSTPSLNGLVGPGLNASTSSPLSLSVNYLPTKFSRPLSPSGIHKRKNVKGAHTSVLPKQGGGREAFKSGEARMPGDGDEDYDGVNGGFFGGKKGRRLRWNKFKIILFAMNTCVSNPSSFLYPQ